MYLSIIICSFNRKNHIVSVLNSLFMQDADSNKFEVIFIDNNSTDGTKEVYDKHIEKIKPSNFKYFIETEKGLSAARNRGLKESKGDVVLYVDDDADAHNNLVNETLNFYKKFPQAVGMGGKILPYYESNEPFWYNHFTKGLVTCHDKGNKLIKYTKNDYPAGCNMSYKREALESVGGFDPKMTLRADDKYIYHQVSSKVSNEVYYNPSVLVFHFIDDFRLQKDYYKYICTETGNSERKRIENKGFFTFFLKLLEYIFKLFSSFLIGFYLILFKGQWKSAQYVVWYRALAIKGLLSKG